MRPVRLPLVTLIGGLLLVGVVACGEAPQERTETPDLRPEVTWTRVRLERPRSGSRGKGRILSRGDIRIAAESAGRIVERAIERGSRVAAGDLLLVIDEAAPRFARDQARVAWEEGAVDPDLPAAERRRRRIAFEEAEDRLARCRVRAPRAGVVEELLVERGETAAIGTPLLRLVDVDDLRLVCNLPEAEALRLAIGLEVPFEVESWGALDFKGVLTRVAATTDRETGQVEIELGSLSGPRPLRPGMFATLELGRPLDEEVLVVPARALFRRFEQDHVFVLEGEGDASRVFERVVRLSPIPGDPARRIIRFGLTVGERLVLGPLIGLGDGLAVRAHEALRE